MAEHVQRPEVGAVGARLINPNGTIEHAGLVLGVNGIAQSAFHGFPAEHPGVNRQLRMTRNYSAVSGACLLMRREVFQEIGGFDETLSDEFAADRSLSQNAARRLSDCLHPACKALLGSARSREADCTSEAIMRQRWSDVLEQDPYYNPNLSLANVPIFPLGK